MKTISLVALAAVALLACDEPKADKPVVAAPSASPAASALPSPSPTPATPATAPKKTAADCKPHPAIIDFGDQTALEAQVRLKLSKPKGDITPEDLAQVKSINLSTTQMHQIDPCIFPMFTSMKDLFLGPGDYDDLSPLAKLSSMVSLRAALSQVKDLRPIDGLTRMDRLDLSHTLIGDDDMRALSSLVNLTELQLDEDNVADLTPIASLKKLERLSIKKTLVKDLTPISGLRSLRYLYIEGTAIADISPVRPLMNGGMRLVQAER